MQTMNLVGSETTDKGELYRRLLVKQDRVYAQGVNAGLPTAWLYDCTIAATAMWAAFHAITSGKLTGKAAEECVSAIEATDFNVYGDTTARTLSEEFTARRKQFARDVALPLYEYYKTDKDVQAAYPGAESLIGYIVREWVEKE